MAKPVIMGQRIENIRLMTDEEMKLEGWDHNMDPHPVAVVLDNGVILYASEDPDGTRPGALLGALDGECLTVVPWSVVQERAEQEEVDA